MKRIEDLFIALENMGFSSKQGKLSTAIPYIILKDYLNDRMPQDIPAKYVEKYNLNDDRPFEKRDLNEAEEY
jgi:hypothetical protein